MLPHVSRKLVASKILYYNDDTPVVVLSVLQVPQNKLAKSAVLFLRFSRSKRGFIALLNRYSLMISYRIIIIPQ